AQYLPMHASAAVATYGTPGNTTTALAAADEASADFYPLDPGTTPFDSARTATSIANAAAWPLEWRQLGLRPRHPLLYCTYFGNAGIATTSIGNGLFGARLLGTAAQPTDWFYALGACNMNGSFGWPTGETVFGVSSRSPNIVSMNDGS